MASWNGTGTGNSLIYPKTRRILMAAETAIDALYKALSSPHPDPDLAHATAEEIRGI